MIYILFFIALFITQLVYFRIADHFNIIDKPNERSSHSQIKLRGGGVIFYIGILFYFIFEGFQYPWFFLGLTLIAIISFADDIRPQSSKIRLLIHFVSVILMFYQWRLFDFPWYFSLVALIVCTGILNAYNFMDGINGITGGYSFVVTGALWFINAYQIQFVDSRFIYMVMLTLIVFNLFNFRIQAKCFAGDVGAISIAFIILFLLGRLILKTDDFSYIVLLAVYGVDTILTIIHRILLKENIFEAHRKHVFQIMANELKMPHVVVSSFYALLQGVIIYFYFVFKYYSYWYLAIVIVFLSVLYLLFKLKYFHKTEETEDRNLKVRNGGKK
jgi:UDP-N-acetylmuramyl pentapeptide phosphotransferase/UDP-N-acetylglucosamine-1-phosphate transferase